MPSAQGLASRGLYLFRVHLPAQILSPRLAGMGPPSLESSRLKCVLGRCTNRVSATQPGPKGAEMLTAVTALFFPLPQSGEWRGRLPAVVGRAALSPGSRQASWGSLGARLAVEGGGAARGGGPHRPCPAGPAPDALTVFLIEELLHLLAEDHLLP